MSTNTSSNIPAVLTSLSTDSSLAVAFSQFLEQPGRKLSTKRKFQGKMGSFLNKYGDLPISTITSQVLEEWFVFLEEKKGYSEGNLAFHRNCFHCFFNFCSQVLGYNPARNLPRYSAKPSQVITANENDLQLALQTCAKMSLSSSAVARRDAAIFVLGSTGLRRSNIQYCRYSDAVHALENPAWYNGQDTFVLRTRGKEPMEAILTAQSAAILRRYLEIRPLTRHDRLFVVLDERVDSYTDPLSTEGFIRARRRVCKKADVPLICFKKMRRLIGTNVAREYGVEVAAQVLGHRSGVKVVIDHYFDPDQNAARAAALKAQLKIQQKNS